MSIVETPARLVDPFLVRFCGYGMAIVGTIAPLAVFFAVKSAGGSQALTFVTGVVLLGLIVIIVADPDAFLVTQRRSVNLVVNPAFIVPIMALVLLSLDTHLVHPEIAALVALAGGGLVVIAATWAPRTGKIQSMGSYLGLLVALGAGFGWGVSTMVDRYFDTSPGVVYPVVIQQSYQTHGRGSSYHLVLAPWGPLTGASDIRVPYATYDIARLGNPVCATLRPGALSMPWFVVKGC
jgi:hypothetical protein